MLPPKVIEKLQKRINRLNQWRWAKVADVPLQFAETREHFRTPPSELPYREAPIGTQWGAMWVTAWFRSILKIPADLQGRRLYYRHLSFCEKLLFVDGQPFAGMNPRHEEVLLLDRAQGGESLSLAIEAYSGHQYSDFDPCDSGMRFHQVCGMDPGRKPPHTLEASELLAEREATAALFHDASVLLATALSLDANSLRRARILDGLNRALDMIPLRWETEPELERAAAAARGILAPILACRNSPTWPSVGIIGYAHTDIAWLWPIRETLRKTARTFSTYLHLMDRYPELTYVQSQPVQIEMAAEHYPALLPRIKQMVERGQWQPNGGMWIEAGCNVPSGESLVRQFLEGRKVTMKHFGYQADVFWMPDVFGYSGALPQIVQGCEIQDFVTSKINWNDTTRFPYDTFWWKGIDGTRLFAHFITNRSEGYNAEVGPDRSWESWNHVLHKEVQDRVISSVGFGDGGGGATADMVERSRRMHDLEGCPKTTFINLAEYLRELREEPAERPEWIGELYLELHRGTYTTEGRIKRYNRKLEFLLREIELWAAMAMQTGAPYPADELEKQWRRLLTNQCHDNIAGSCIRPTIDEMLDEYSHMEAELLPLRDQAIRRLSATLRFKDEGRPLVVANPLGWQRDSILMIEDVDAGAAVDAQGNPLPTQPFVRNDVPCLAVRTSAPSLGLIPLYLQQSSTPQAASPFVHGDDSLQTPVYQVRFDSVGRIVSLVDKQAGREIVQPGRHLNGFYTAEDYPIYWDAFDIDRFYRDVIVQEERLLAREVIIDGPLFTAIRSHYEIARHSTLTQEIIFYADSRRIDFRTEVDWNERHCLLKTGFAVDVHSTSWRNEIQFGHIERPRHGNRPADQAQFEVCAHKWVDVSENDYGVALLNDCKYGHDALDAMVSLTLLRAPEGSNERSDTGHHRFTYALFPHQGGFNAETVVREAFDLNVPLEWEDAKPQQDASAPSLSFCACDNPNVVIDTIKRAEEEHDAVILRVYEAGNTRGRATLQFPRALAKAATCNLIERQDEPIELADPLRLEFEIRPFQLRTFKLWFEK